MTNPMKPASRKRKPRGLKSKRIKTMMAGNRLWLIGEHGQTVELKFFEGSKLAAWLVKAADYLEQKRPK